MQESQFANSYLTTCGNAEGLESGVGERTKFINLAGRAAFEGSWFCAIGVSNAIEHRAYSRRPGSCDA
jgi:hypothetical protein